MLYPVHLASTTWALILSLFGNYEVLYLTFYKLYFDSYISCYYEGYFKLKLSMPLKTTAV